MASSEVVEAKVDDEDVVLEPELRDGAERDEFDVEFDTVLPFDDTPSEPARGAETLFV